MTNPWSLTGREAEALTTLLASSGNDKAAAYKLGIGIKALQSLVRSAKDRMDVQSKFDALITWDRAQRGAA